MLVLNIQIRFAAEDFGSVNFKNLINILFMILWYMHTNQGLIKKNYLNQIKEIFLASRVDNSSSFSHNLPSRSSSPQGMCGHTD